jgi:hypothetical protein
MGGGMRALARAKLAAVQRDSSRLYASCMRFSISISSWISNCWLNSKKYSELRQGLKQSRYGPEARGQRTVQGTET